MANSKVAIITGGASGLGFDIARSLSQKGWRVHAFDLNVIGEDVLGLGLSSCAFHQVDVASWDSLSSAFHAVFKAEGRLDFVFANAGVMEKGKFFERHNPSSPPPEPEELSINVNLKGITRTSYLAQHYFRANVNNGKDCVLIMTSSVAGIYPQSITPLYSAAKAGIINFMRSVAPIFYEEDGIRTYAICPGSVRTNILPKELWDAYPQEYLTQMQKVTTTIESLIQGTKFSDSWGQNFEESSIGLVVEIFVDDVYFRGPPSPCNDGMKSIFEHMRPRKGEYIGEKRV
ncbi:15-hydroxyprostaglandin dehydrogenase [NAD(+)] [Daldinia childiae]|uniref:15-hydroxyprostaglandin dehydrogenase [NAD(+)] n=1 Tax=Daldinia childiae TaxID=326645 RepID=UPI001445B0F1|nr:15-hydroxyprostaglandin dehydrogenase [NAD(+)] [Daldinia childiae]KAF3061961.1 15-hydroxyprostaglandin dehydrogenase [NAD(+)] [Daldinia childiae]